MFDYSPKRQEIVQKIAECIWSGDVCQEAKLRLEMRQCGFHTPFIRELLTELCRQRSARRRRRREMEKISHSSWRRDEPNYISSEFELFVDPLILRIMEKEEKCHCSSKHQ